MFVYSPASLFRGYQTAHASMDISHVEVLPEPHVSSGSNPENGDPRDVCRLSISVQVSKPCALMPGTILGMCVEGFCSLTDVFPSFNILWNTQ